MRRSGDGSLLHCSFHDIVAQVSICYFFSLPRVIISPTSTSLFFYLHIFQIFIPLLLKCHVFFFAIPTAPRQARRQSDDPTPQDISSISLHLLTYSHTRNHGKRRPPTQPEVEFQLELGGAQKSHLQQAASRVGTPPHPRTRLRAPSRVPGDDASQREARGGSPRGAHPPSAGNP